MFSFLLLFVIVILIDGAITAHDSYLRSSDSDGWRRLPPSPRASEAGPHRAGAAARIEQDVSEAVRLGAWSSLDFVHPGKLDARENQNRSFRGGL